EGKNTSSRQAGDERYEQGTPEYLEHVALQMANSDDPRKAAAGQAILDALSEDSVQYTKVTQPTQPVGANGLPPPARVEEFTGTLDHGTRIPTAADFAQRPRDNPPPPPKKKKKK